MLSFEPSEEQKLMMDSTRKFASRELREHSRAAEETGELPAALLHAGWNLGLLPANIPEPYGGFGERSAVTGVLAAEELACGDLSGALALTSPSLVALPVLLCGSDRQKEELLPMYCSDVYRPGSAALMEPRYDFDPRALTTTATLQGDRFLLSGEKCNVPYASEAPWMLVFASLGSRVQAFLVERGAPGLAVRQREKNMGVNAIPLYSVELRECAVPAAQRLGGEAGCDLSVLLNSFRVAASAMALGVARAAYEYGLEYAKNRKAFGEAIAQRQSIAFMLAEMITDLEAARLMVWEAAWLLDRGRDATRAAALARVFVDDMVLMVADRAVQILGGHGYIRDHPVELWLRNARGFAVLEGLAIV